MLDFFSSLVPPCLELGNVCRYNTRMSSCWVHMSAAYVEETCVCWIFFLVTSAGLTLVTLFHAAGVYGLAAGAHMQPLSTRNVSILVFFFRPRLLYKYFLNVLVKLDLLYGKVDRS